MEAYDVRRDGRRDGRRTGDGRADGVVVRERRSGVGGSGGLRALTVGTAGVEGVRKSVILVISGVCVCVTDFRWCVTIN